MDKRETDFGMRRGKEGGGRDSAQHRERRNILEYVKLLV